jgi:hypothetical protein
MHEQEEKNVKDKRNTTAKHPRATKLKFIGKNVGGSHNTVKDILRRAQETSTTWSTAETLNDNEIEHIRRKKSTAAVHPEPDMEYIDRELMHPSVNLKSALA